MRVKKSFTKAALFLVCILSLSFGVLAESITLTAGSKEQAGGEIVLTETEAGMFQKGELIFSIASDQAGIYLEDVDVETSGGIKKVKSEIQEGKKGSITLTIDRESKEKGTIKLSHFVITTDRTVPEGSYNLEISGSSISAGDDKITVKNFIQVITPNTEDCYIGYVNRGTSIFTLGQNYYIKDSEKINMDAAPFIAKEGYMMVPLRYVADAFGIEEKNIIYAGDTIMLFTGTKSISLTKGSCEAVVNGSKVVLEMPLMIKEGRSYVAVSQIAHLLGMSVEWNAAQKTAIFTDK